MSENTPQDEQPEDEIAPASKSKLSEIWNSPKLTPLRVAFKIAAAVTSPVWYPTKKAYQVARWGLGRESKLMKTIVPTFAAVALAGYLGTVGYGATYGYVVANDQQTFLNWPATQGKWEGDIVRFSHKGTWPCDSWEGSLRTGEAADFESFAVRKGNKELIDAINNIPEDINDVTLVYRDNRLDQSDFEKGSIFHCIQHSDHTAVGIHYMDRDGNRVSVGVSPSP